MHGQPKNRILIVAVSFLALSRASAAVPEGRGNAPAALSLQRVLILKDGAIYRGEVIELVPHEYVILRLRSGAEKRFAWSEIDKQSIPGALTADLPATEEPVPAEARKAPMRSPAPRTPTTNDRTTTLSQQKSAPPDYFAPPRQESERKISPSRLAQPDAEIAPESTDEDSPLTPRPKPLKLPPDLAPYKNDLVLLQMRSPQENLRLEYLRDSFETGWDNGVGSSVSLESWKLACVYPCGEYVYRGSTFRVTAPNMVDSPSFSLPKRGRLMELKVAPGNPTVLRAGIALDVLGAVAFTVGVGLMVDALVEGRFSEHRPLDDQFNWGLGTTLVSGVLLGTGIALTRGGRTRISVARPADPPPPPRPSSEEAPD